MWFIQRRNDDNTDIVERFQLSLMLVAIGLRNLIELSASEEDNLWTKDAVLPKAFGLGRGGNILWTTFSVRFFFLICLAICLVVCFTMFKLAHQIHPLPYSYMLHATDLHLLPNDTAIDYEQHPF